MEYISKGMIIITYNLEIVSSDSKDLKVGTVKLKDLDYAKKLYKNNVKYCDINKLNVRIRLITSEGKLVDCNYLKGI